MKTTGGVMGPKQGAAAFECSRRFYSVDDMRISPDGVHVACGCWFGQRGLFVWRFGGEGAPELVVGTPREAVRSVRFSADGALLFVAGERTVRVLDMRASKPRSLQHSLDGEVASMAVAPEGGDWAAVLDKERVVVRRTLLAGNGGSETIASKAISATALSFLDAGTLLVGGVDRVTRHTWASLEETGAWRVPEGEVRCIEVSPDRQWLGVAGFRRGRGVLHFIHATRGSVEHSLGSVNTGPSCVAFSSDGARVATVHDGGEVRCHRVGTWETTLVRRGQPEALNAIAFWPGDRRIVAAGRDPRRGPPLLAWGMDAE